MLDPFRGEMTAKYVHEDDLRWAASERLLRESRHLRDRVPARRDLKRLFLAFLPAHANRQAALKV